MRHPEGPRYNGSSDDLAREIARHHVQPGDKVSATRGDGWTVTVTRRRAPRPMRDVIRDVRRELEGGD